MTMTKRKWKDKNFKNKKWRLFHSQSQVRPLLDEKSSNKWICFWNMQIRQFRFSDKRAEIQMWSYLNWSKKSTIHQEKSGEWTGRLAELVGRHHFVRWAQDHRWKEEEHPLSIAIDFQKEINLNKCPLLHCPHFCSHSRITTQSKLSQKCKNSAKNGGRFVQGLELSALFSFRKPNFVCQKNLSAPSISFQTKNWNGKSY